MTETAGTPHKRDLISGPILKTLLRLAVPIMGTQLMQMAYNVTDMFWLGRVSSDAVASSGTAGLFMWLSMGPMLIGRAGAEIGVAQSLGRGQPDTALQYSRRALHIAVILGILFGACMFLFGERLVGFFQFKEAHVAADTVRYLAIIAAGIPMSYITAVLAGTFTAAGNAKTPFLISGGGLVINMILDPVLILGLEMGVGGAALASVIAQSTVACLMLLAVKRFAKRPFARYTLWEKGGRFSLQSVWRECTEGYTAHIFRWALPICLESSLFCMLSMGTARLEVGFGAHAVAVTKVGTQIESLSWLVGGGFGSALVAFVGQNYGADRPDRISRGVRISAWLMTGWGLLVSALLYFGGGFFFTLFLPDPALRALGVTFSRILASCQLAMNLETVAANAFRGVGRTIPPSVTSIVSNALRIPLAYALSRTPLGLPGIWMAVCATTIVRALCICTWYYFRKPKKRTP